MKQRRRQAVNVASRVSPIIKPLFDALGVFGVQDQERIGIDAQDLFKRCIKWRKSGNALTGPGLNVLFDAGFRGSKIEKKDPAVVVDLYVVRLYVPVIDRYGMQIRESIEDRVG